MPSVMPTLEPITVEPIRPADDPAVLTAKADYDAAMRAEREARDEHERNHDVRINDPDDLLRIEAADRAPGLFRQSQLALLRVRRAGAVYDSALKQAIARYTEASLPAHRAAVTALIARVREVYDLHHAVLVRAAELQAAGVSVSQLFRGLHGLMPDTARLHAPLRAELRELQQSGLDAGSWLPDVEN